MTIPVTELARRICAAYHPYLGQVQTVPCAEHTRLAQNTYVLIQPSGAAAAAVIVAAQIEADPDFALALIESWSRVPAEPSDERLGVDEGALV